MRKLSSLIVTVLAPVVSSAVAQDAPHFSVHGYLTQGYAASNGAQIVGIGSGGTFDYRRAAVIAGYNASARDRLVVQLAHRRLGDSQIMEFEPQLKLDMAFFEHRFEMGTRLRVGKAAMPFGIYNEARYAGTLLPFYRAPLSVYWEGTYTPESIDGVVASHEFRSGQPWSLSTDLYAGSNDLLEFGTLYTGRNTPPEYRGARMKNKNVVGTQVWLTTPIDGLRVGANARRFAMTGGLYPRPADYDRAVHQEAASIDGSFERWQLRAEGTRATGSDLRLSSGYVQLGLRPLSWLGLNGQTEVSDLRLETRSGIFKARLHAENALGLGFFLTPATVVKLEVHANKGFLVEQPTNWAGAPIRTRYLITSISTSF